MILARSPKYILSPDLGVESGMKLTLKINDIDENDSFLDPDYVIVKNKPAPTTQNLAFEISNLIEDKFDHTPIFAQNTGIFSGADGNALSVNYRVEGIGSNIVVSTTRENVLDGYGHHLDGPSPKVPDNKFLLENDYYVVNKNGYFNVPIYNDGTYIKVYIGLVEYPLVQSSRATSKIKNLWIKMSDYSGVVKVQMDQHKIFLEVREECRYSAHDIMFKNKYGAWEIMTFFKAKKENIKIDRSTFKNNGLIGAGYNKNAHTYQDFNINAREGMKLNSGYVPETYNKTIQQLLLSKNVFLLDSEHTHIPLNVDTNSYQYKTRLQDKLISHEIDFKYAFDLINNI